MPWTYNNQCADKDVGGILTGRNDLADEVGSQADYGNEGDELQATEGSEGDAQGAELRSLETHSEGDRLLEIGDERESGTRLVQLEGGTQGKVRPRRGDGSSRKQWRRNLERGTVLDRM